MRASGGFAARLRRALAPLRRRIAGLPAPDPLRIDGIPPFDDVPDGADPLAWGRALEDAEYARAGDGWRIVTVTGSGGYSAILPLRRLAFDGAVEVSLSVDVEEGRLGVALIDDGRRLLHERVTRGPGPQTIMLHTGAGRHVRAVLLRNMSAYAVRSAMRLRSLTVVPGQALPPVTLGSGRSLVLPLRGFRPSTGASEAEGAWWVERVESPAASVALVLVDVWADHECAGWQARADAVVRSRIAPAAAAMRAAGGQVIHAPHDRAAHPDLPQDAADIVLAGGMASEDFADLLVRRGIRRLIYAGFASNMCIMTRPVGMLAMVHRGFGLTLLRDASIAMETPASLAGEGQHAAMVAFVEINLGTTLATDDLIEASANPVGFT